jgi:hypothetical protein
MKEIKAEDWKGKFRERFHSYTMDDPRDVMVEECSGDIEDFIRELIEEERDDAYDKGGESI